MATPLHSLASLTSSLRNAFDTAVADSVLNGRHYNTQRGLGKVLVAWLGDAVVHLTHKGKLTFTPGMLQEWPLPMSLFVYAYERRQVLVSAL